MLGTRNLAALAILSLVSQGAMDAVASSPPSVPPPRNRRPTVTRIQHELSEDIRAHNAEVDRKKAERKANRRQR